jgi:hypothetical protein
VTIAALKEAGITEMAGSLWEMSPFHIPRIPPGQG